MINVNKDYNQICKRPAPIKGRRPLQTGIQNTKRQCNSHSLVLVHLLLWPALVSPQFAVNLQLVVLRKSAQYKSTKTPVTNLSQIYTVLQIKHEIPVLALQLLVSCPYPRARGNVILQQQCWDPRTCLATRLGKRLGRACSRYT
jgi:hypothetical protein